MDRFGYYRYRVGVMVAEDRARGLRARVARTEPKPVRQARPNDKMHGLMQALVFMMSGGARTEAATRLPTSIVTERQ